MLAALHKALHWEKVPNNHGIGIGVKSSIIVSEVQANTLSTPT